MSDLDLEDMSIEELAAIEQAETQRQRLDELDGYLLPVFVPEIYKKTRISVTTGIEALDTAIGGGLRPANVTFVCAPPGAGKTGLLVTWALEWARAGVPVLFVQLEVDAPEMTARFAAQVLDVATTSVLDGDIEQEKVAAAVSGLPIIMLARDPGEGTLTEIEALAMAMRSKFGRAPVIVVDFIQQLSRGGGELRQAAGNVAYGLKGLARKLDVHIIGISSVSRAFYGSEIDEQLAKDNPAQFLSAAKESGDIEFAAGTIIYVQTNREAAAGKVTGPTPARLAVAKARHGEPRFIGMDFWGASGKWTPNPGALDHFGPGLKEIRKRKLDAAEQDELIGAVLGGMPATGQITKRELARKIGRDGKKMDEAIDVLIRTGEILATTGRAGNGAETRLLSLPQKSN